MSGAGAGVRGGRGQLEIWGNRTAKIQLVFFLECDSRPMSIDAYRGLRSSDR